MFSVSFVEVVDDDEEKRKIHAQKSKEGEEDPQPCGECHGHGDCKIMVDGRCTKPFFAHFESVGVRGPGVAALGIGCALRTSNLFRVLYLSGRIARRQPSFVRFETTLIRELSALFRKPSKSGY